MLGCFIPIFFDLSHLLERQNPYSLTYSFSGRLRRLEATFVQGSISFSGSAGSEHCVRGSRSGSSQEMFGGGGGGVGSGSCGSELPSLYGGSGSGASSSSCGSSILDGGSSWGSNILGSNSLSGSSNSLSNSNSNSSKPLGFSSLFFRGSKADKDVR